MDEFVQKTLAGLVPAQTKGEGPGFRWQWLEQGVIRLTPHSKVTQSLILSAGIHGNETAPVEILSQVLDALWRGDINLCWDVLVVLGNPLALQSGKRYQACDLNRLFGGRWAKFEPGTECARAELLEQVVGDFFANSAPVRWHLDMHTAIRGSLHPRFGVLPARNTAWPAAFLHWLELAGLEALVFHQTPGGTFTHFTAQYYDALSCTMELGKAMPFGQNNLSVFSVTRHALGDLLSHGPETLLAQHQPVARCYKVSQQLTRTGEKFILHIPDDTVNFTPFSKGVLLAEDGKNKQVVQQETEYVLFPNPLVAQGLRAGLMLTEIPHPYG